MKKQLTAIVTAAAIGVSVTGCMHAEAADLMQGVSPSDFQLMEENQAIAYGETLADFAVRMLQSTDASDQNTLLSPLSVMYALAMTANGAAGETRSQMEQTLGLKVDTLNEFLATYRTWLPQEEKCKLHIANSIWYNDQSEFVPLDGFLQANADYYAASLYKAPFDEKTCDDINDWVKKETDGMISDILDEIPEDIVMYLVNALAFSAQWSEIYEETQIKESTFTTEDGTQRTVTMMHSTESSYIADENATGFLKYYAGGEYAFAALLPNEGVSIESYIATLNGDAMHEMLSTPQTCPVIVTLPQFETQYSTELSSVLEQMGMPLAFDRKNADFSRMGTADGNLYVNRVLHETNLAITPKGTVAGAATVVEMICESVDFIEELYEIVNLDRPFVYMLIDCKTHTPFFIGTMMDPEQ